MFCLRSLWATRGYMVFALPILIPAMYLLLPALTLKVQSCFELIWVAGGGRLLPALQVDAHAIAKVMEISVGVNLALSFIEEFGSFALDLSKRFVEKLNPDENPTLAEAVSETAQEDGAQLGAQLDPQKLQGIFWADLEVLMGDLHDRLGLLLTFVKKLGYLTAFLSYVILARVELGHGDLPLWVAILACVGAAFPVALHISGSMWHSGLCWYRIRNPLNHGPVYQAFVRNAMSKLAKKTAELKRKII